MMVVIANKLRDNIESSALKNIEHKSAVGCYEAATFVKNLKKLQFDKLLIDMTAIRDAGINESWDSFKELLEANNVFILYDDTNCDKMILSNLVSRGFYNFSSNVDEISKLIEHPNMFADVQKYMISSIPKKTVPTQEPVIAPSKENSSPKKMIDQDILDAFKNEYRVSYDDVNLIPTQLLTILLIYGLLAVISFILIKLLYSDIALKMLNSPPSTLDGVIIDLIIFGVCFIAGTPIIRIAKSKTNSILRFLIVPTLLSLPILLVILKLLTEMNVSIKLLSFLASIVLFYVPFVGTLLVNGSIKKLNSESVDVVKWNIFEKIGMVIATYIFIIPLVYLVFSTLNITIFDGIYSTLYFTNSNSDTFGKFIAIICTVIPILIMVFRMISQRKKGK